MKYKQTPERYQETYRVPTTRVDWHDYNDEMYHVVLCEKNRAHVFGHVVGDNESAQMYLSALGRFVEERIQNLSRYYAGVQIPEYQIMPDHIHILIDLREYQHPTCRDDNMRRVGVSSLQEDDNMRRVGVSSLQEDDNMRRVGVSSLQEDDNMRRVGVSSLQEDDNMRRVGASSLQTTMQRVSKHQSNLSRIIGLFKSAIKKHANQQQIPFEWEARYYDTIVTKYNYSEIVQYIQSNVWRWHQEHTPWILSH